MNWMDVIAGIAHVNAITLALLQMERSRSWFSRHGICHAVDCPAIKPMLGRVLFFKEHFKGLIRGCGIRVRLGKAEIVPPGMRRRDPLCLARSPGILYDDSHTVIAVIIGSVAHDPYARMVHLHNCRNPFCSAQPQHRNAYGIRYGIAIQGNHVKGMSGQRQTANLSGASIQNMEEDPLALLYANRLSMMQLLAVNRERVVAHLKSMLRAFLQRRLHG